MVIFYNEYVFPIGLQIKQAFHTQTLWQRIAPVLNYIPVDEQQTLTHLWRHITPLEEHNKVSPERYS